MNGHREATIPYGFYSNVNPTVDHPRWSETTERRIGDDGFFAKRRQTFMFNGYLRYCCFDSTCAHLNGLPDVRRDVRARAVQDGDARCEHPSCR
jgi:hypothetical protein